MSMTLLVPAVTFAKSDRSDLAKGIKNKDPQTEELAKTINIKGMSEGDLKYLVAASLSLARNTNKMATESNKLALIYANEAILSGANCGQMLGLSSGVIALVKSLDNGYGDVNYWTRTFEIRKSIASELSSEIKNFSNSKSLEESDQAELKSIASLLVSTPGGYGDVSYWVQKSNAQKLDFSNSAQHVANLSSKICTDALEKTKKLRKLLGDDDEKNPSSSQSINKNVSGQDSEDSGSNDKPHSVNQAQ